MHIQITYVTMPACVFNYHGRMLLHSIMGIIMNGNFIIVSFGLATKFLYSGITIC
jgi:hypothetical protein